jgi:aspartokinase
MVNDLARNESPNGWIVQKFGGTSVGKFPNKIAEDIIRYARHHRTDPYVRRSSLLTGQFVIVCSGHILTSTRSSSYAQQGVRARKPLGLLVGRFIVQLCPPEHHHLGIWQWA